MIVAVEITTDAASWHEPERGRFVVIDSQIDAADQSQVVTLTGIDYWQYFLTRTYMQRVSSSRAPVKNAKRKWTKQTIGRIWRDLLDESTGRGWGTLSGTQFLDYDFSAANDSNGTAWSAHRSPAFPVFQSLADCLTDVVGRGYCEWSYQANTLRMFPSGTGTDHGNSSASPVRIGPKPQTAPVHAAFDNVYTNLIVIPEKGKAKTYSNSGANTSFGRLESTMTMSGLNGNDSDDVDDMDDAADAAMGAARASKREIQFTFAAAGSTVRPFADFNVGDVVSARSDSTWENLRVTQIVVSKNDGQVEWTVVLAYRFRALLAQALKRLNGTVQGSVAGNGNALPTPNDPGTPIPNAPTGLAVTSSTPRWSAAGRPVADVVLTWDAVTQTTDDEDIDIESYDVWVQQLSGGFQSYTNVTDTTATIAGVPEGNTWHAEVRARGYGGVLGAFCTAINFTAGSPSETVDVAPDFTSDDVVVDSVRVAHISWDGLCAGVTPPPQLMYVRL